jgi:anti-sigma B factor antagonist
MSRPIALYAHSSWNPGDASWFAMFAGITCPARTTTNSAWFAARRVLSHSGLRNVAKADMLCGPGRVAPDSCSDEEEIPVALKMTSREVDGVTVIAMDGRIVLGEESNALREGLKTVVAEGKKKVVLNMDNITFIDSAGLGTLVASHHSARNQGASLRLCHLGTKFQEVLQITKLMTIFEVYNTEPEAIASFKTNPISSTSN